MTMVWIRKHPQATPEMLGYLPEFISENDPARAREQLDAGYKFAGGWQPFKGFKMLPSGDLSYPGDPPMRLLYETQLRGEIIRFYECAWVAIVQQNSSFEVCRMD